ncbi:TIGR00282 family metallophosphoesterase [Salidesulfovibrio onnuriiensis]|uniref:TIGR00282 family metallophosphoesterase n=1 Tax=Salidesulfovibrio onnuriiensis TaxID=2583823 RepID=UPI0011C991FD|nr:TIGR00282 family metallophosphoesterase [Salidesulfovibrio onnuriiensis]
MRILFLGDVVGRPGRSALKRNLAAIRSEQSIDLVLANGENASGGIGLSSKSAKELFSAGVDFLTTGNHIWKFKDMYAFLDKEERIVRPANYPAGAPGRGWALFAPEGFPEMAVINLMGRTYMQALDCPFAAVERILEEIPESVRVRIVDFHAEATSEKQALAWMLDGRVSAVLGTHTHVQTNDARVLPQGTAYLTDLGMCGPLDSCLGMDPESIIKRFTGGLPQRFHVADGPTILQGAIFDLEESSGAANSISVWHMHIG